MQITHNLIDREQLSDGELIRLARAGDQRSLDVVFARYRAFAIYKAKPYFIAGSQREDVVQEAFIGLYKAIRDFDPDRQVAFITFAGLCIGRQIQNSIKCANRARNYALNSAVALDSCHLEAAGSAMGGVPSPYVQDPVKLVVAAETAESMRDYVNGSLSRLERTVLTLFLQDHSYEEIAAHLSTRVKSIDNALRRTRCKLQVALSAESEA